MSIHRRFFLVALFISVVPVMVVNAIGYFSARASMRRRIAEKFEMLLDLKRFQLVRRFQDMHRYGEEQRLRTVAVEGISEFIKVLKTGRETPESRRLASIARHSVEQEALEDYMLVANDGTVVYTAAGGPELGLNLLTGPYKDTHAARCLRRALQTGEVSFEDFAPYPSDAGAISAFMAVPVDVKGKRIGAVLLRFPCEGIMDILRYGNRKMGKTVTAYLISGNLVLGVNGIVEASAKELTSFVERFPPGRTVRHDDKFLVYAPVGTPWGSRILVLEGKRSELLSFLRSLRLLLLVITLIVVGVASGVSRWMSRKFSKPILHLRDISERIARGELNFQIQRPSEDELGDLAEAMDRTVAHLREMVSQIQQASQAIHAASSEILSASEQQAAGAGQQAASIGEVTATVEELGMAAQQIAESGKVVADLSDEVYRTVEQGHKVVNEGVQGIRQLREEVDANVRQAMELGELSERIGEVLDIIGEIAVETKMLALNAAIEAGRAGEHGKGFAVVAQEVRRLAEGVMRSTDEVRTIVEDVRNTVGKVVVSSEGMARSVGEQETKAHRIGELFEGLQGVVEGLADSAKQIALSTEEQRRGVEEVAKGMTEVHRVSDQSAAAARQVAESVQRLNQLAQTLGEMVRKFQV